MTVLVPNSLNNSKANKASGSLKQTSSPQRKQAVQLVHEAETPEMQEVQNLPFESAKLKAEYCHWSERCSSGIHHMLTNRQHRHDAVMQTYLATRFVAILHTLHRPSAFF